MPANEANSNPLLEKLASVEQRSAEVERLLADPEISKDYTRVQGLAKEHASLKRLVSLSREYSAVTKDIDEALAISRDDSDREMAALARQELSELEERKRQIEEELRVELLPRDPTTRRTSSWRYEPGPGAMRRACSPTTSSGCTRGTLSEVGGRPK